MAQEFVMLHTLINGHGNFGSVDNDPAAAMRYTEAKLSSLAYESLLVDIKEDTVDFIPNFDGTESEPVVLPSRLPMLLLNGASGIAVGMATNIPPHNLNELCDAMVAMIKTPEITPEELLKFVPAPDFPTGGLIMGTDGAKSMYMTGHGSVTMRAKCSVETISSSTKTGVKTRTAIVITELPYMTNKASLLEKIADMVNDKKLDGISDLRDESDRDGVRIVIELKRDAIASVVQNNLFKKTSLQIAFSGNMLALVDSGKQPVRVSLHDALREFIKFIFETKRRRTAYQLKKLEDRDHIVQGLLVALNDIDKVISILRNSVDTSS
jgi:DNA gyrase subunit A